MYRIALVGLVAIAFLDLAAACPPAPHRNIEVNGVVVKEYYCDAGKVLYMHDNVYRCFERSIHCLNGFWHQNKCHCFPGTCQIQPGVCGQICQNCQNGWCYSTSKCVCNDGFRKINGLCLPPPPPFPHQLPWCPHPGMYLYYGYSPPTGYANAPKIAKGYTPGPVLDPRMDAPAQKGYRAQNS